MLDFKRYRWMKILPFLFDTIFILFKNVYYTSTNIYTPYCWRAKQLFVCKPHETNGKQPKNDYNEK